LPILDLDDIDKKLIELLQDNADLTYAELGKMLGISPSTVYTRVKRLKERGFIKRIVAEVSPEMMGYNLRALVFLSVDVKKYNSIMNELLKYPQIKVIYDITGEWTFALEIMVRDHKELTDLLDKVGSIEGVQQTSTAVVLRVIKEDRKVTPI
jgi:DNA-binding Lrp family transcriptional regulator